MRKIVLLGLAALVASSAATLAATEPAKQMETSLGKVWTNPKGMTLYVFDQDAAGVSNCNDQCATNWPPLKASAKAKAMGEWSVVTRKDGSKMWAYSGKPLYTFIKDKKPGDVTGEGVGGVWHVAK